MRGRGGERERKRECGGERDSERAGVEREGGDSERGRVRGREIQREGELRETERETERGKREGGGDGERRREIVTPVASLPLRFLSPE